MIEWKNDVCYLNTVRIGFINRTYDVKSFVSPRVRQEHYFRNKEGFGIAIEVLNELENKLIDEIVLPLSKEKISLVATPETWRMLGEYYKHPKYEAQLILPERYFQRR